MRRLAARLALLGAALATGGAPAQESITLEYLGRTEIRCDDSVRFLGKRKRTLPRGKYETLEINVGSDVVPYQCGNRRRKAFCPIDSTRIEVRRRAGGRIAIKCYGTPYALPPSGGAPAAGEDS